MSEKVTAKDHDTARDRAIRASTLNRAHNPVVAVRCIDRFSYEAEVFPYGYPLPTGYVIAARWKPTAGGRGRWVRYEESLGA